MASSSPSEFLTFYRTLRANQAIKCCTNSRSIPTTRPFSQSIRILKDDIGGPKENKKHATEKGYDPNVQTHETKKGRENRAQDKGGVATEQKSQGAHEKAKKEFPEAPTTIGFEAERGGKL